MIRISLIALLSFSVFGEQTFLSVQTTTEEAICLPGMRKNKVCNRACALPGLNDGGDCTRADYCRFVDQDFSCQAQCYDYEHGTDDCYCDESLLGDGKCDLECMDRESDGGDCVCDPSSVGNRVCNVECMREDNGWDGGDCFTQYARF